MADSISIVMKMNDDISGKLKSIASTSRGVSKEFETLMSGEIEELYAKIQKLSGYMRKTLRDVKND